MATNTTNFDLVKPAGSDSYDISSFHNGSMDKIDSALQGLGTGLAIISKNNTHVPINEGEYVYIHGHGSLAEGLYKATMNIVNNGTLNNSCVTPVSGGLGKQVATLSDHLNTKANASIHINIPESGSVTINLGSITPKCLIAISRASDATFGALYMVGSNWTRTICPIVANTKYTLSIDNNGVLTVTNSSSAAQVSVYF